MKTYPRSLRVAEIIQREISELLRRKIKDPRLRTVTITDVKLSRDLRSARVYFITGCGEEEIDRAHQGLKSATGYMKRWLAGQLDLRYMPEIRFFYDNSMDTALRIERLLAIANRDNGIV